MNMSLTTAIGILLYPGLALVLVLGLALRRLVGDAQFRTWPNIGAAIRQGDGLVALASILLATVGVACAPLPFSPIQAPLLSGWSMLAWLALEAAFLAPALMALLAPSVITQRAASRDMQIGLAGRVVVWAVIGALASPVPLGALGLLGRVVLLLGGLLALPAAAGLGPFAPEHTIAQAGAESGLDERTAGLLRFARSVRAAALLAVLVAVALAPFALRPVIALLIALALLLVVGFALRALARWPLFTLPSALRWCWTRALPVALIGLVMVVLVES